MYVQRAQWHPRHPMRNSERSLPAPAPWVVYPLFIYLLILSGVFCTSLNPAVACKLSRGLEPCDFHGRDHLVLIKHLEQRKRGEKRVLKGWEASEVILYLKCKEKHNYWRGRGGRESGNQMLEWEDEPSVPTEVEVRQTTQDWLAQQKILSSSLSAKDYRSRALCTNILRQLWTPPWSEHIGKAQSLHNISSL